MSDRRSPSTVSLPSWAIGALVGALLAVAYLLGRSSAAPVVASTTAVSAPRETVASERTSEARPPSRPVPEARLVAEGAEDRFREHFGLGAEDAKVDDDTRRALDTATADSPREVAPARERATDEPVVAAAGDERARIRRYFTTLDAISAPHAQGDNNARAESAVKQGVMGDGSALEDIKREYANTLSQLREMEVPSSCKEHHTLTMRAIEDGLSLLELTRAAATTGDVTMAARAAEQGNALLARTREADELAERLRAEHGIPEG